MPVSREGTNELGKANIVSNKNVSWQIWLIEKREFPFQVGFSIFKENKCLFCCHRRACQISCPIFLLQSVFQFLNFIHPINEHIISFILFYAYLLCVCPVLMLSVHFSLSHSSFACLHSFVMFLLYICYSVPFHGVICCLFPSDDLIFCCNQCFPSRVSL